MQELKLMTPLASQIHTLQSVMYKSLGMQAILVRMCFFIGSFLSRRRWNCSRQLIDRQWPEAVQEQKVVFSRYSSFGSHSRKFISRVSENI